MFSKVFIFSAVKSRDCVVKDYAGKVVYPFPKRQNLDSSNLKELADDNFEFDKKSGESSPKG